MGKVGEGVADMGEGAEAGPGPDGMGAGAGTGGGTSGGVDGDIEVGTSGGASDEQHEAAEDTGDGAAGRATNTSTSGAGLCA